MLVAFFRLMNRAIDSASARICRTVILSVWVIMLSSTCAVAQSSGSEHDAHHPTPVAPGAAASTAPTNPPSSPRVVPATPEVPAAASKSTSTMPANMGAMKGMMGSGGQGGGCCAGGLRNELYPFLMGMPDFTPEGRVEVRRLSEERIEEGTSFLVVAQGHFTTAIDRGDHRLAASAMQQMRGRLGRVASGVFANRLLKEGVSPQNVAVRWFKDEMGLSPIDSTEVQRAAHGISPLHLVHALLPKISHRDLRVSLGGGPASLSAKDMETVVKMLDRLPASRPAAPNAPGASAQANGCASTGDCTPATVANQPTNRSALPVSHPRSGPTESMLNCVSCHATKDRHHGLLGSNCIRCHATDQWKVVDFRPASVWSTECAQCHRPLRATT